MAASGFRWLRASVSACKWCSWLTLTARECKRIQTQITNAEFVFLEMQVSEGKKLKSAEGSLSSSDPTLVHS